MTGRWIIGAQLSTSHSSSRVLRLRACAGRAQGRRRGNFARRSSGGFARGSGNLRGRHGLHQVCGQGFPLVQPPFRHRRHGRDGPRRRLARRTEPRLGRLGGKGRRGQRDVPFRLPEQSGGAREDARAPRRASRSLSLHGRLPRQAPLSFPGEWPRRVAELLLRSLPRRGEGDRPRSRCGRASLRRSCHPRRSVAGRRPGGVGLAGGACRRQSASCSLSPLPDGQHHPAGRGGGR